MEIGGRAKLALTVAVLVSASVPLIGNNFASGEYRIKYNTTPVVSVAKKTIPLLASAQQKAIIALYDAL